MTLFNPDYLDESRRAHGELAPLDAEIGGSSDSTDALTDAGSDSTDGVTELELDAELEDNSAEGAGADSEPQTREAYLKKGEDLIRSLL